MKYGLIGPGAHGRRYLLPENGGDHISLVLRQAPTGIPGKVVTNDLDEFIDAVDAAIIATPPESHRDLAIQCLTARVPVLIEKPLALDYDSCMEIIEMGKDVGVPVMVAHTHLFHPHFEDIVLAGLDGDVPQTRVTSYAGGPGPIRSYSALMDWAPHDVAMAIACFKESPRRTWIRELSEGTYELTLQFPTGEATIVVSNRFPEKCRLFTAEHTWDDGVERYQYRGDEPTSRTPLGNMTSVFRAMVEDQLSDYRADPHFLESVYTALTTEPQPQAVRRECQHS